MKILILDTVHGGDVLAERLMTDHEVVCSDVYGITDPEIVARLRSMFVEVSLWVPPPGEYDLVLRPEHCPDFYLKDVESEYVENFSWAVGQLLEDDRPRIEVTGVKGKTSVCYLLAHVLSHAGNKVFLHTSRGRGEYSDGKHLISENMSIAPPSLLRLPEGDYDVLIQEVSLGGSGKADVAVITNLAEDYGIAKDTRKASEAKKWILSDGINVVPSEEVAFWEGLSGKRVTGYGGTVELVSEPRVGEPLQINLDYMGVRMRVSLSGDYLSIQYVKTIECVARVCEAMGDVSPATLSKALTTFRGVPGRGELSREGGMIRIIERNPGVSALSIGNTLASVDAMGGLENSFAIVDPVSRKVCETLVPEDVKRTFESRGVPYAVTEKGRPRPVPPEGTRVLMEFIKEGYQ
ncbi:MAG: coenzyme F430 synthase [Thermoplasmatales archaeon]|nr:coenzyme F430 synthase [Thermoplasmatales archaeon]